LKFSNVESKRKQAELRSNLSGIGSPYKLSNSGELQKYGSKLASINTFINEKNDI